MTYRRKLIEVALPLEAINKESAREKSIRHGHPSTLHPWWARRPLAACRAVLWSSLVDDPSEYMPDETSANEERERLFKILEELVLWENINNEEVLDKAKLEIARSVARDLGVDVPVGREAIREFLSTKAPPVVDPFAGGGSIPLEAQRLGRRAYASDLNPVAVLINKALIEIPPKFAGMHPVHPSDNEQEQQGSLFNHQWKGADGLAEDVRYYGKWIRDEAFKRIGYLYPKAKITKEILAERPDLRTQGLKPSNELTVIAWLWARTVKCPNPACGFNTPLLTTFVLSSKPEKERFISPTISHGEVIFKITTTAPLKYKHPEKGLKRGVSGIFECVSCGTITTRDYVSEEGKAKRIGLILTGLVAQSQSGRVFLPADASPQITNLPKTDLSGLDTSFSANPRDVWCQNFGLETPADLFTDRQLVSLDTFSHLVMEAHDLVLQDIKTSPHYDEINSRCNISEYADAIATYLGLVVSRTTNSVCTLAVWS
jgi:putative DNA methylase